MGEVRNRNFEGTSDYGHCAGLHSSATFRRVAFPDLRGRSGVGVASPNGRDEAGRLRRDSSRRGSRLLMTRLVRSMFRRTDCHGPHLDGNRWCTLPTLLEWRGFAIPLMHLSRIRAVFLPNPRPRKQIKNPKKIGICAQPTMARAPERGVRSHDRRIGSSTGVLSRAASKPLMFGETCRKKGKGRSSKARAASMADPDHRARPELAVDSSFRRPAGSLTMRSSCSATVMVGASCRRMSIEPDDHRGVTLK